MQKPAQVCKSLHKYTRACTSKQKPAQVSKSLHKYAKAYKSIQKHIQSKSKFDDIFFPPLFKFYDDFFPPFFKFGTTFQKKKSTQRYAKECKVTQKYVKVFKFISRPIHFFWFAVQKSVAGFEGGWGRGGRGVCV
jgi:hypothetical protein